MRHALATAVAALALLAAAGPAGAQAPLPPAEALSANVQNFVNTGLSPAPYLTAMRTNGWAGARGDAFWYTVEPTAAAVADPNKWAAFDALKAKYEAGGVRWQPILEGSPGWARNTTGSSLALPSADHVADFARFAAEFVARYGPGGPLAGALPVTDVELYNEENARGAGAYTADPAVYGRLFAAAYGAMKAASPSVRVIIGAVLYDSTTADGTPTDAQYISGILSQLTGADGIALHPYAPTAIGVTANLRRMVSGLTPPFTALPAYVNELGYPAALDGATPKLHAAQGPTTDAARAGTTSLLTDALLASDCSVRNIAYFDLVNQENNKADTDYLSSETWKGLIRRADASLTVTGAAYRDAGARWRANPAYGSLHVCGPEPATPTPPLGLELTVDRPSALCLRPTVAYRGFPIEEATVVIRKSDGKSSSLLTDANGRLPGDFCVDDPVTYTLQAEVSYAPAGVPRFAQSIAYSCRTGTVTPCTALAGTGPGAGGGAGPEAGRGSSALSAAGACLLRSFRVTGSTRLATVLRKGLKLRAKGCRPASGGDRTARRLTVAATVARSRARALRLTRRTPKKPVTVASGSRRVTGTRNLASITVTVRFSRTARTALRRTRRVQVSLGIRVTEGAVHRTVTRKVTLRR